MTLNCWNLFTETFWLAFVLLCVHIYIKNWHTGLNGKTANTWSVLYFSTQNPIFWLHRGKCLIFKIMNNRKERGKKFFLEWNVFCQSGFLSLFFTHVAYWLNVFWHNCYTFLAWVTHRFVSSVKAKHTGFICFLHCESADLFWLPG